jgi:hypothetical protein
VLWNQAEHTDRELTANMPGVIIKNKKDITCILIDVAKDSVHKCHVKGSRRETEIQEMHMHFVDPYGGVRF